MLASNEITVRINGNYADGFHASSWHRREGFLQMTRGKVYFNCGNCNHAQKQVPDIWPRMGWLAFNACLACGEANFYRKANGNYLAIVPS